MCLLILFVLISNAGKGRKSLKPYSDVKMRKQQQQRQQRQPPVTTVAKSHRYRRRRIAHHLRREKHKKRMELLLILIVVRRRKEMGVATTLKTTEHLSKSSREGVEVERQKRSRRRNCTSSPRAKRTVRFSTCFRRRHSLGLERYREENLRERDGARGFRIWVTTVAEIRYAMKSWNVHNTSILKSSHGTWCFD